MDTRISLYKLEVFCAVVERESVTRAAEALRVSQPVVTGHVRSLEARLGVQLFVRRGRGLALTPGGQITYDWAAEILARTQEVGERLEDLATAARARVAVVVSIGEHPQISELIVGFQARHRHAAVNLRQLPTEQAVEQVRVGACDFALVLYREGVRLDATLQAERLRDDEVVLVTAATADLGPPPTTLEDLIELPFVCTPAGSARRNFIDAELGRRGVVRRRIVMEIGPEPPLHAAVRDGLGFALLSHSSVASEVTDGRLLQAHLPGGALPIGLDLISRRDLELSPARQAFVDLARELLGAGAVSQT